MVASPDIGRFARACVEEALDATVVAVFSRATYLRFDGTSGHGLVVLTTLEAPPGPLHVRITQLPRLRRGDTVVVEGGQLVTAAQMVELPHSLWIPPRIDNLANQRSAAEALLGDVLATRGLLDVAGKSIDVCGLIIERGLRAGLASLAGRGAGLTPAGDDCAAGILLATALLHGDGFPTYSPRELSPLVANHESHEIAVAFLEAAAAGESIEPLHLLLRACTAGDRATAIGQREVLAGIGRTSGLDLAYGAWVGLALAGTIAEERARGRVRDRMARTSQSPA